MAPHSTPTGDRFGRLLERRDGADFPFYDGRPVRVGGARWVVLVLSVLVALVVLSLWPWDTRWGVVVGQIVFFAIPLLTLIVLVPHGWRSLFRRFHARDLGPVFGFWLLTLAIQLGVGSLLGVLDKSAGADPGAGASVHGAALVPHFLGAIPQLLGEELFALLPFLAVLWLGVAKFGWSRKTSIIVALIVSSLLFGAAHLPTYHWNWPQALVGIGLVRVGLTLAYIRTKNLWVSFGAHLLTDWLVFLVALR